MTTGTVGKASAVLNIDNFVIADLLGGLLESLQIIEATNMFVPSGRIRFNDANGLIVDNLDRLMAGSLNLELGYPTPGAEPGDVFTHQHVLFTLRDCDLSTVMSQGSVTLDLVTWSRLGPNLMLDDKILSFGPQSASAIAQIVASAVIAQSPGSTGIATVEPGADLRSYIQADWTDAQFLRHLANQAVSTQWGTRGFLYFFDREENFTFASPKFLFETKKVQAELPTHKLNFSNIKEEQTEEHAGTTVLSWSFTSQAQMFLMLLGYTRLIKYFDETTSTWIETLRSISAESATVSDSVNLAVNRELVAKARSFPIGRLLGAQDIVLDGKPVSSLFGLQVLIKYSNDIKLGDVVRVTLPSDDMPDREQNRVVIDSLSGLWTVSKIIHHIDVVSREYLMKLMLTRSGTGVRNSQKLVPGTPA